MEHKGVYVYMLLDVVEGSYEHAVQMLRSRAGVVLADRLESRNDIIAIVEAPDRQRLADVIMPIIGRIDGITEDLHLLVTRDNVLPPDHSAPRNSRHVKERIRTFPKPGIVVKSW